MMQAQFDRDTEIKRREAEIRESEEVRRQAGFDVEMADLKFERDIEKRKGKLAMNILETESRIEKIESAKPIEDAVKRVGVKGRAGKKLPITSNKKAMQVLNLKKEQMQDELRVLIDPLSVLPEQIGAKTKAEIGLLEKRTGDVGKPKTPIRTDVPYSKLKPTEQTSATRLWEDAKFSWKIDNPGEPFPYKSPRDYYENVIRDSESQYEKYKIIK